MEQELKVVLFGTGGFAANYLEAFRHPERENVHLVGAVDPFAKDFDLCPLYPDAEAMLRELKPDIAVIGTPIQFHAEQAELAFSYGCNVVLEKPIAADLAEARRILEARDRAGKRLNIDYQLCYDPVIRQAKADADSGKFGAPVSLRAIVLWPRGYKYYHRGTGWAGKKTDASGRPVYDSVLNNATAHYLMNMLYMTGAPLEEIRCATYRANPIETYDTAVVLGRSAGADVFIAVSHAIGEECLQNPMFEYRFENAVLRFGEKGKRGSSLTAEFRDGTRKDYGAVIQPYLANFWNMVDAIRNGTEILCSGETALLQTAALESMRKVQPEAVPFPEDRIEHGEEMNQVSGLADALWDCYSHRKLPGQDFPRVP